MSTMAFVLGWVFIGFAAAIAAFILPFRRGLLGIAVNTVVGIAGATSAAIVGLALGMSSSVRDPFGFALAGLGAVAFLALLHVMWERSTRVARHAMD